MPLRRWTEGGQGPAVPFAVNRDSPQARGLVAWYPTILLPSGLVVPNVVGGAYTLTPGGTAPVLTMWPGVGAALDFTGGSRSIKHSASPRLSYPLSFTCWFRLTSTSGTQTLVANTAVSTSNYDLLDISGGVLRAGSAAGGVGNFASAATSLSTGVWYFGAAVFTSSTLREVFLNVGDTANATTSRSPSTTWLEVGGSSRTSSSFSGYIFDVRVYDRAMSQADLWHMFAAQTRWDLYLPLLSEPRAVTTQTFTKSINGTLSTAGALARGNNRGAAGTLSTAGAVVRSGARAASGTLSTSGTVASQGQRRASGTLSTAGAVVAIRAVLASLSGTLTTAGAVVRSAGRGLTGTLTTAGAIVRQARRTMSGTLTTAGALSAIRAVLASLSGTLTTAGAIVRQARRTMSGTLTTAGAVVRQGQRRVAGTLTTAGALTALRAVLVGLGGTLTTAGQVVRRGQAAVGGTLTTAGQATRQLYRTVAGTLSTSGAVAVVVRVFASIAPVARTIVVRAEGRILALADEARGLFLRLAGRQVSVPGEGRALDLDEEARRLKP